MDKNILIMQRNVHVDFLRGVAILLVLLLHFALAYGLTNCPLSSLVGQQALKAVFYNGNYGVTIFFVVSGYLITSMSLARWGEPANMNMRAFYTYRFARIMPSLLLALFIIVTLGCFAIPYFMNADYGQPMPDSYFVIAVLSILSFWHNVLMQSAGWFNYCLNIYWSLSVEEVFYLALPLAFLILRRKSFIAMACLVLIIVAPIYRYLHSNEELYFECGYLACFDAIAMGCLTAMWVSVKSVKGSSALALRIIASIAFVVIYLRGINAHETFGFSLVALCAAAYLIGAVSLNSSVDAPVTNTFVCSTSVVRWFGRHSYELYLFHIIVLALLRNILDQQDLPATAWFPWLALFIAASAMTAALVSKFLSEPANLAIRRRWRNSDPVGRVANPQ